MSEGRSRRRWKRGKAAGVATGACDGERSWRMVVLGRRIVRGGRERWNQGVSDRSEWTEPESERKRRSDESARSRWKIPMSGNYVNDSDSSPRCWIAMQESDRQFADAQHFENLALIPFVH